MQCDVAYCSLLQCEVVCGRYFSVAVILVWHTRLKERERESEGERKRERQRATEGRDREREGVRDREWREDEREK